MIISKTAKVKLWGRNITYYKKKGYIIPGPRQYLEVKIEDLDPNSYAMVTCRCDFCKENEFEIEYFRVSGKDKHACANKECIQALREETMLKRYGVRTGAQCPDIRKKMGDTREKNTGYRTPFCNPKDRANFEQKRLKSLQDFLYSNRNPWKDPDKRESIAIKTAKTKYENQSMNISKPEQHLHDLLGGEHGYPILTYNVDMAFVNEKIAIEYDGGYHLKCDDIHHRNTKDVELQHENKILSLGWKLIRIQSINDTFPKDEDIITLVEFAKFLLNDSKKVVINFHEKKITSNSITYSFHEVLI